MDFQFKKMILSLCMAGAALTGGSMAYAAKGQAAQDQHATSQHYTIKNVMIGELPVKTIVPITAKTAVIGTRAGSSYC